MYEYPQHWGLSEDVLDYQVEIAHAAIDAGADVVMGHGPHYACAVEMYRGKPIFYGLGSFSFHTGHGGRAHGDWVGLLARLTFDDAALAEVAFALVRHDERNQTYVGHADQRRDWGAAAGCLHAPRPGEGTRPHRRRADGRRARLGYSTGQVTGRLRVVGGTILVASWQRELEIARREDGLWRLYGYQR